MFPFIKTLLATQIILVLSEICPLKNPLYHAKTARQCAQSARGKGNAESYPALWGPGSEEKAIEQSVVRICRKLEWSSFCKCLQGERNAARSCVRQRGCDNCNKSWVLQTVWRNTLQNMTRPVLQKLWRRSINSFGTTWSNNWTQCKGNLTITRYLHHHVHHYHYRVA